MPAADRDPYLSSPPRSSKLPVFAGIATGLALLVYDPRAYAGEPKLVGVWLVALGLAAVGFATVPKGRARVGLPALLALLAVGFLSLSWAWGAPAGVFEVAQFGGVAALALAVGCYGAEASRRALYLAATTAGGGAGLVAVCQWAWGARGLWIHGTCGNPNVLGALLAISVPVIADRVRAHGRRWYGLPFMIALFFAALGLGLSHARVAWVAVGVALFVGLVGPSKSRLRRALPLAAAAALVLAGAGLHRVTAQRLPQKQGHLAHSTPGHDPADYEAPAQLAIAGRWAIARYSVRAAMAHLPWGSGAGSFEQAWLDAQGESLRARSPKQAARAFINAGTAHNETLQMAVEGGPVAVGLWLSVWVATAYALWRSRLVGLLSMVVALAGNSLGESVGHQLGPSLFLAFAIAATRTKTSYFRVPKRWVRAAVIALCALGIPVSVRGYWATRLATLSETGARTSLLRRAARLCPERGDIGLGLGLALAADGDFGEAITQLQRAQSLGAAVAGDIALGAAELEAGDAIGAESAFRRALWRNPGSFRARLDLASSLFEQGRLVDSEQELTVALGIEPGHPAGSELLERIHRARLEQEAE